MDLSSIGLGGLGGLGGTEGVRGSAATSSGSAAAQAAQRGDSPTSISKPAELLSKLGQLAASDPAKFGNVASDVATGLKDAAKKATGEDATRLNELADNLAKAAKHGNMSPVHAKKLKPKVKVKPRPHPHAAAAPGGAAQSALQGAISKVDVALASSSAASGAPSVAAAKSASAA